MWLSVSPSLELRIGMDEDLESNTKAPPMQAPRSRLLLSCGESILAVAERSCRRVETMACPMGCLARGFSRVAAPVLSRLRRLRPRCLSALSFVDRQLVVAQDVAAVLLPRRAERVLRKVDGLVLLVESLPVRFDGAADGLEALVAGMRSGVAAGLAPTKRRGRDDDGGVVVEVFRDIRCDEEAGGAVQHRDVEKISEDVVAPEAVRLEVVTVSGGDDDGGAGDGTKTVGVASAEKITAGETRSSEEMAHPGTGDDHLRPGSDEAGHDDDDAAPGAYTEAMRPEAEKQEAGSDASRGDGDPTKPDMSVAEQCAQVVKQDSRVMEVVETHDAEIMEAVQSTGTEKVESQLVASPEAGTSETAGEGSGKESSNRDGDLLDLFDEAWQHKLEGSHMQLCLYSSVQDCTLGILCNIQKYTE